MATYGVIGQQPKLRPRFEVEKLDGTTTVKVAKKLKAGGFEYTEKEVDAGYMVYFPGGHSIRVLTEGELARLGFTGDAHLIDMATGEDHGPARSVSLKDIVASKSSKSKPRVSDARAEA